jgi:hypothetical protein
VLLALAVTFGGIATVIITLPVSVHPLVSVPVTIYAVVAEGKAAGDAHAVQDSPVEGVHT